MPFGPYKDFADCVKKNKGKKNPRAYCAAVHKRATGKWPTEARRMSETKRYTITTRQLGNEKNLVIYMENEEGFCEGWVFPPVKVMQKNKLEMGTRVKKVSRAPIEMLDFTGVIPIGKPGASRNFVGIYKVLEQGSYGEVETDTPGTFRYKFSGKKLNGSFLVTRLEDKELIETSKYQYVFDVAKETLNDELLKQLETLSVNERGIEKLHFNSLRIISKLGGGKLVPLTIKGIALKEGEWYGFFYPKEELMSAGLLLQGKPLMIDHSTSVRDLSGTVTRSWYNDALSAIEFEAEVTDEAIAKKIIEGLITSVSVGVEISKVFEGGRWVARNYVFKELSLVLVPAVKDAKITEIIPPK